MPNLTINQQGLTCVYKMFKNAKVKRIKKVLPDGTRFSTIRLTTLNGDVYSKTKVNGKTILTVNESVLPASTDSAAKDGLYTSVKRFLPNGDISFTTRFINYYKKMVLSFNNRGIYPVMPTKQAFPTKEIVTTTDLYRAGSSDGKRVFTSLCQESPIGQSTTCNFLSDNAKIKEIGVLRTKFVEKQGRLTQNNLNIRYVK